jgi:S1-C subfamily serine protease
MGRAAPEVAPAPRPVVDLTGYRTTKSALRADPKQFTTTASDGVAAAGYLGVLIEDKSGKPVVEAVAPESPADDAGLREGDVVVKLGSRSYTSAAAVRDELRTRLAGDEIRLTVKRDGKTLEIAATLEAASRPMTATGSGGGRALLGVSLGGRGPDGGVKLADVTADWPAAKAGLKAGDVILKADGKDVDGDSGLREIMATKRPGDRIDLIVDRDGAAEVTHRPRSYPSAAPLRAEPRTRLAGDDIRLPVNRYGQTLEIAAPLEA